MKKISNIILWSYVTIYFIIGLGLLIYIRMLANKTQEQPQYSVDNTNWQEELKLEKFSVIVIDNHSNLTVEEANENFLFCNSLDSIKINLLNDTLFVHTSEGENLKITFNAAKEIIATEHANIIIVSRNAPQFKITAKDSTNISVFNSQFSYIDLFTNGNCNITFSASNIDTLNLYLQGNTNVAVVGKKPVKLVTGFVGENSRISYMPKPETITSTNRGEIIFTTF